MRRVRRRICRRAFCESPGDGLGGAEALARSSPCMESLSEVIGVYSSWEAMREEFVPQEDGLLGFPVQPGIVDRDGGAAGQLLGQSEIREAVAALGRHADEADGADALVPRDEGHRHAGADAQGAQPLVLAGVLAVSPELFAGGARRRTAALPCARPPLPAAASPR